MDKTPGSPRPAIHLTPDRGWLNDPHGVIHCDGRYHVFYQSNPGATQWTTGIHWGHATSPDLVTWTNHAPVLGPGDGDDGIWTGCAARGPDGIPVIFYTSASGPDWGLARIRTAYPDDSTLMTWHKGHVVAEPPIHDDVVTFRDPIVRYERDHWRMFVGAGLADGRPALASYTSDDLRHWSYTGLAAVGHEHDPWTGSAWECPQLVTVGDRALLLVAAWHAGETLHVMAGLGAYRAGQLTVDHWQRVGYGTGHYAPTTFTDLDGQPCALFWIREIADSSNSWAGALSIPYRIHLLDDRVEFRPHPAVTAALARLRDGHTTMTELVIGPTSQALTIPSEGGGELLRLNPHDGTVIVQAGPNSVAMPLPPDGEPIQVITDGAVLEVCTGIGLVGLSLTGRPVR